MKRALQLLGFGGALLFGLLFVVSFVNPLLIERAAREVVRIEVERRVGEKVEALSNARIVVLAQKALGRTDAEIEAEQRRLAADIPARVANAVADLLNADCECRKRLVDAARSSHDVRLKSLGQVRERLTNFIEAAYKTVTDQLLRELRIFSASNAIAFVLVGLIATFRRGTALQLALPAALLLGASALTGGLYLFNQDWLHTILFGRYVGFAYIGYLGLAASFLADIVYNRARITTALLNAMLHVAGSTMKAVPC